MSHEYPSPLDPADNTFRIRLACVLLETSGTYFSSGSSKRRLDYFLVFLQAYYWFKRSDPIWQSNFPVSVDYLLRDTLTALRPKLSLFESYEQAQEEVQNVRKNLGIGANLIIGESGDSNRGLDSIAETDAEMDEETSETVQNALSDDDTSSDEEDDVREASLREDDDDEDEQGTRDDKDEESDEDGDEESDEGGGDTAEEEAMSNALPSRPKHVTCTEDDEFVNALDKMVSDNIQERMRDNVKPAQVDISVPMTVRSSKKTYEQLQVSVFSLVRILVVNSHSSCPEIKNFYIKSTLH